VSHDEQPAGRVVDCGRQRSLDVLQLISYAGLLNFL
jgi:hypothetical protein